MRFTPLALEAHLNLKGTATPDQPQGGKLDGQFGFAAEALPGPGTASLLEVDFAFQSMEGDRDDCMMPDKQCIAVPGGTYSHLFVLGTAVMGSAGCEVIFEYRTERGRERKSEILKFTDWCHAPQFGDRTAVEAEHRYSDAGPVPQKNALRLQVLWLPPGGELVSVTFGWSPDMRLFAATLGSGEYSLPPEERFYYLMSRLGTRDSTAGQCHALYYTLLDIHRLRKDERLRLDLEGIRDRVLELLSVEDLFQYDEARLARDLEPQCKALEAIREKASARLAGEKSDSPLKINLVGHSHLDAVWLWPWNVTVGKAFRTFARNLERLKKYEGVTFAQSTPLFYEVMEKHYPEVFKGVEEAVRQGQWELVGGMWVEPDGNMPCGEALVRQRLYGQRYFLEKFGRLSEVAWIPDTFGMHANHPQIIRKTGGRYFYTTKLMWNYENKFPFQHFVWEGPDGSRVLALQSIIGCGAEPGPHDFFEASAREYNTLLKPGREVIADCRSPEVPEEAKSSDFITEVLSIYGEGDGGEGPSDRMYQRARTLALLPEYHSGTVHDHFHEVEEKYMDRLPVWRDELYLENHRGTTSSQARIKELNRKGEARLLTAEKWAMLSRSLAGFAPKKSSLDRAWKKLLFNQFHDILPGTSIAQAYVDAELDFEDVLNTSAWLERQALRSIASKVETRVMRGKGQGVEDGSSAPDRGDGSAATHVDGSAAAHADDSAARADAGEDEDRQNSLTSTADTWAAQQAEEAKRFATGRALLLFNPLAWIREETVKVAWEFPWVRVYDLDRKELPSQVIYRDGKHWLFFHVKVPAFGYTQVRLVAGKKPPAFEDGVRIQGRSAENRFYRLDLDEEGRIEQLFDKIANRNLLAGPANRVQFFKNHPREWSNWNLDPEYEKHELLPQGEARVEIVDPGPVVAAFRVTRPAPEGGRLVQEIRLYRDDPRIDFVVDLDVNYRESLIKAAFPFDVGADFVTTEIGYGTYDRPVKPSTAFEKAKWEVWTQKYLDLSGPAGGVTLVNSAKYGFDVKGDTIRLTLVKGGIMPDTNTDLFTHRIDYGLVPHAGSFQEAHAWKLGYGYNFPIRALLEEEHAGVLPSEKSFAACTPDHVCWEAFKPEEDGDGYVLRVYEVEGRDAQEVCLDLPFSVREAEEIDFLEREVIGPVKAAGSRLTFSLGHHEIKAIRVYS